MEIRQLEEQDIPRLLELCSQVGWNHIASDWQRLLELFPETTWGAVLDGRLVGSCTIAQFGQFGWVGTFLLEESLRGSGLGKQLFSSMLERAGAAGITTLGLDSSDAGRAIYTKKGFALTGQDNTLMLGDSLETGCGASQLLLEEHWALIAAMDQEQTGVNRLALLKYLAAAKGSSARVKLEKGRLTGFGFSRPGKNAGAIGPILAETSDVAEALLMDLRADRYAIDGPGKVVACSLSDETKALLESQRFTVLRALPRMHFPAARERFCNGDNIRLSIGLGMS